MDLSKAVFKRQFSLTLYKNKKISLGEMSFFKDFVNDKRGDPYPVIYKSNEAKEEIRENRYFVNGNVTRLLGKFFPFATYEINLEEFDGECGFEFHIKNAVSKILLGHNEVAFYGEKKTQSFPFADLPSKNMVITCRPGFFDVYFVKNGQPVFFCTFCDEGFENSNLYCEFANGFVAVCTKGSAVIKKVDFYIDCGISQADMRPVCYENGDVITENGKIFFTASVRQEEKMFQGIFSIVPTTAQIEFTGAVFFDSGDGRWCGDVASTLKFNREDNKWYIYLCSFNHGHILARSCFDGDIRFGVNVLDVELLKQAPIDAPIQTTHSIEGDEDPNFIYDEENDRWLLAVCRLERKSMTYKYVFFQSKEPFGEYEYLGQGFDGAETGGSFVKIENEMNFICGNAFDKTSDYRVYTNGKMSNLKFDFNDGGFRGWGSVIPIKMGSRTRYFLLTFDRHNGSNYNWSYGNIYLYEAEI